MAQKVVAVVVGIVGLYLNTWHGSVLPFNHFAVFGGGQGGFGSQHYIHAFIGLALLIVAAWLWFRAPKTVPATSPTSSSQTQRV